MKPRDDTGRSATPSSVEVALICVMQSPDTYIRLTRLDQSPSWDGSKLGRSLLTETLAGPEAHPIPIGYSLDGWFLHDPTVGMPMVMLRFRRNALWRLGRFSSSLVTAINKNEIWTENSVYTVELRSFVERDFPLPA